LLACTISPQNRSNDGGQSAVFAVREMDRQNTSSYPPLSHWLVKPHAIRRRDGPEAGKSSRKALGQTFSCNGTPLPACSSMCRYLVGCVGRRGNIEVQWRFISERDRVLMEQRCRRKYKPRVPKSTCWRILGRMRGQTCGSRRMALSNEDTANAAFDGGRSLLGCVCRGVSWYLAWGCKYLHWQLVQAVQAGATRSVVQQPETSHFCSSGSGSGGAGCKYRRGVGEVPCVPGRPWCWLKLTP
jgi:hypothetical protein